MKCYYHNDLDGRCAGAIVYKVLGEGEYIEVDYKDDIDIAAIKPGEKVVIVDFSFKPKAVEQVLKITQDVIWIDHHKTAFEYKYVKELDGLRDSAYSGCELAFKYFLLQSPSDVPMPKFIELIGDRDKWAWKFGRDTAAFNIGMQLYPHQPKDGIWETLFNDKDYHCKGIMAEGDICLKFRDSFCKDYADSYGFETIFEGHKCFALGIYMFASEAFGERMEQYDICLSFVYLGNKWTVGLYSTSIDVSEIAKKYGGGGHKGAAGFVCNNLPFKGEMS